MAWISFTGEERAEGLLKEAYERVRRVLGRVIPFYVVYSVSPRLLHAHLDFYGAVAAPSALFKLPQQAHEERLGGREGPAGRRTIRGGDLRDGLRDGLLQLHQPRRRGSGRR